MLNTILATKLYIPEVRPQAVVRHRLMERLEVSLHGKLTLISAPAGFGKTTLISEWISQSGHRTAWLSLDEGDSDPLRFLTYTIAALQTLAPQIGVGILEMLQASQSPPIYALLTTLLNEITTISERFVLILDDYHLVDSKTIDDALAFVLERQPPNMHLVIGTREDPRLPLARLRARGQLTELRSRDLRFTPDETAEFLNRYMGLRLSAEAVATLDSRTEGWITGLQLAAISMKGHQDTASFIQSFTGSHHYVLDYLVEEVLQQQPVHIQRFLIGTSYLDHLCGSLCDAVLLDATISGQDTLETLRRNNLFIVPLDDERRWYRYHHLFADLLRQRLHQAYPEQILLLHYRASEWFEQNRFMDAAIAHALRGTDYPRAARLIETRYRDNYELGSQMVLRRWLAELPEALIFSRPQLCVLHAWNLFTDGDLNRVNKSLVAAEELLAGSTQQDGPASINFVQPTTGDQAALRGQIAAIRSFLASYNGDMLDTIRLAHQALEALSEHQLSWRIAVLSALGDAYVNSGQITAAHRAQSDALNLAKTSGDAYMLIIAHVTLAETLRQQGQLQQVIKICQHQYMKANADGFSEAGVVGWLLGIWSEALAELNDLNTAIEYAQKGAKLAADGGDTLYQVKSTLYLTRVLFSSGHRNEAQQTIRLMLDSAQNGHLPRWAVHQASAWQARFWLAAGNIERASQWAQESNFNLDGELNYLGEMEHTVFARIFIAQGLIDEAWQLLTRLLEVAQTNGRRSKLIELLNLQALAAHFVKNTTRSLTKLEEALLIAQPEGFVRVFVDEASPMARLLQEAIVHDIVPDYARQLLSAFPLSDPQQLPAPPSSNSQFAPLTQREIEILRLIGDGLTNPEIAFRLTLSLNTVKSHTRSINAKLDVTNRIQAVNRARALGIIDTI